MSTKDLICTKTTSEGANRPISNQENILTKSNSKRSIEFLIGNYFDNE